MLEHPAVRWLDELLPTEEFGRLCDLLGAPFVALSAMAGAEIVSVDVEPRTSRASAVHFTLPQHADPKQKVQRFSAQEFRQRLVQAFLAETHEDRFPSPPDRGVPEGVERAVEWLGEPFVRLSVSFGLSVETLCATPEDAPRVLVRSGEMSEHLRLTDFRTLVQDCLKGQLQHWQTPEPTLDLEAITSAQLDLARGDHASVVAKLQTLPNVGLMLVRSHQLEQLPPSATGLILGGLRSLARALNQLDRIQESLDAMRVAVQIASTTGAGAEFFHELGELTSGHGRHGEAIGYFRRALSLGHPRRQALFHLAKSFHATDRHVAAMACMEEVQSHAVRPSDRGGMSPDEQALMTSLKDTLGLPWAEFRGAHPVEVDPPTVIETHRPKSRPSPT